MTQFNNINEFNNFNSEHLTKMDLIDYFKKVHSVFYKDIDITFMDYFLEICQHDDKFVIHHDKLKEYKVIENGNGNKILNILKRRNLIESIDFEVAVDGHLRIQGGISTQNIYHLTPYAFKICLIKSNKSNKYAKYYLLLEKIFNYYNDYQQKYTAMLLSGKDTKIDEQSKNINDMKIQIDDQSRKIDELLNFGKATVEKLDATNIKLDEVKKDNEELKDNIDILDDNIDDLREDINNLREDKHERCEDDDNDHYFSLIKLDIKNYKFIRGSGKRNDQVIQKFNIDNIKIDKEYTPNSITLFTRVKEQLNKDLQKKLDEIKNNKKLKNKIKLKNLIKENVLFKIKNSKIILNQGSEMDLIEYLHKVNEKRKYDTTS